VVKGEPDPRFGLISVGPVVAIGLLAGPIAAGLIGVLLPAFGYLPALGGTAFSLDPWRQLLEAPGLLRSVELSLSAGLISAALSLAITSSFLAAFSRGPLYTILRRVISPLLAVPHAAAAFGLAFLISPSGLILRSLSPWATGFTRPPDWLIDHDPQGIALIAGLTMKEVPFLLLVSLAALPQIEAARHHAIALTLGYQPATAWMKVVAPRLYPLIRLPIFAVIAYGASVVDMALILGPTNPPPLSVMLLRWMNDDGLDMRFVASAGAVLQVVLALLALALWRGGELVLAMPIRRELQSGKRRGLEAVSRLVGGGGMPLIALMSTLGLLCLAMWSIALRWPFPNLAPEEFTMAAWSRALRQMGSPLWVTVEIALASALVSVVVVVSALEWETRTGRGPGPWALRILYAPLVVPSIAFLFGVLIALTLADVEPGLIVVILGHMIFVMPYVYLSLSEPYRRLDPRWAMVAATLGKSPARAFLLVRLPLLLAPLLTAFAVGFAVSVSQYLPTLLLGAGRIATVTTEAVALASGGDRREIGVYALVQTLLPSLGFALAIGAPRLAWRNRLGLSGRN
jgi:putative thiamine transport system permease protein